MTILGQIWRAVGRCLWNAGTVRYEKMIADCESAVESVSEFLTDEFCDDIRSYFYARESCLGIETLIVGLCEFNARLSEEQFRAVEVAAIEVGVSTDRIGDLRSLVVEFDALD